MGVEMEMQTDPTPSFPAVMDEVNKLEDASRREGSLEEIFRRSCKIVGVDPGIHAVRTTIAGTNAELFLICSDSRCALGEKGTTIKMIHKSIHDSTGIEMEKLKIFVERA